jgi:hypothetical protein
VTYPQVVKIFIAEVEVAKNLGILRFYFSAQGLSLLSTRRPPHIYKNSVFLSLMCLLTLMNLPALVT